MKLLICLLTVFTTFSSLDLSCSNKENLTLSKKDMTQKIIPTLYGIKNNTLKRALEIYQKPIEMEKFNVGEGMNELRITLYNHFSPTLVKTHKIPVTQVTWALDKDNNITAFYRSDKKEKPIEVSVWNRNKEF